MCVCSIILLFLNSCYDTYKLGRHVSDRKVSFILYLEIVSLKDKVIHAMFNVSDISAKWSGRSNGKEQDCGHGKQHLRIASNVNVKHTPARTETQC